MPYRPSQRTIARISRKYSVHRVTRLLKRSFIRFRPWLPTPRHGRRGRAIEVQTGVLGEMLLESLRKYTEQRDQFGRVKGSLDAFLKPVFDTMLSDATRRDRAASLLREAKSIDPVSRQLSATYRGPRTRRADANLLELKARRKHLALIGKEQRLEDALKDLVNRGLLQKEILLEDESPETVVYRHLKANLREVRCEDPEEIVFGSTDPGDEIYVITSASVFDARGVYESNPDVSDVDTGVQAGDTVDLLPARIATMLDDRMLNGPDDPRLSPLYVGLSVSVIEHEYSDIERVRATVTVIWSSAKLMAAAVTGNLGAVVNALSDLLRAIAVLLDGDDELGTVAYVADDVLTGPNLDEVISRPIRDSHLGNDYEYIVNLELTSQDVAPEPGETVELRLSGDQNLRSTSERVTGRYRIRPNAQVKDIHWSADPPQVTEVLEQDQLDTRIKFKIWGDYTVSVRATVSATGQVLQDTIPVFFEFDSGSGEVEHHRR